MSTIDTATVGNQTVDLSDLDDEQRYEIFDRLQRNLPAVWDAMRLNLENESVVVIPSVTLDRLGERQRQHDAGLRGAVPLPAPAAARAAAAHGVRHVDTDRARPSSSTTWRCSLA